MVRREMDRSEGSENGLVFIRVVDGLDGFVRVEISPCSCCWPIYTILLCYTCVFRQIYPRESGLKFCSSRNPNFHFF